MVPPRDDNGPVRPVIVAANWKMNTTPADAGVLAAAIAAATQARDAQRVICPPFVSLAVVHHALLGTGVEVGAQNVHAEPGGAFTGEISAPMLASLASWCIVGHSERRRDQGESDELIGRKLERCREHGLRPILCVGEQLGQREAGKADETVRRQLRGALRSRNVESDETAGADRGGAGLGDRDPANATALSKGEDADTTLVIAYEPVWAIGTGRSARGSDAAAMAATIRSELAALGWPDGARGVPILYGGSVTSSSIGEFLAEPALDGALVGGASLKVDEMAGIVARAQLTAAARRTAEGPS